VSGLQSKQSPGKAFLAVDEFSMATGLSESTVRRYIKKDRLPFTQPGGPRGRILIPAEALTSHGPPKKPDDSTRRPAADGLPSETKSPNNISRERLPGPKPRWARGSETLLDKTGIDRAQDT